MNDAVKRIMKQLEMLKKQIDMDMNELRRQKLTGLVWFESSEGMMSEGKERLAQIEVSKTFLRSL